MILLEETFYVGEQGFDFVVETGMDMTGLGQNQVRSVLKRPDNSYVRREISGAAIQDPVCGRVLFAIRDNDFSIPGRYQAQVWIRDSTGRARPCHPFYFDVEPSAWNDDVLSLFAT